MQFTATVSVEEAGAALGLGPVSIRRRIKSGALSAVRVGRHWRIHAASVALLLGSPPSGIAPVEPSSSASNPSTAEPVFGPDDERFLAQAIVMQRNYIPEYARLATWILKKHQRFARSVAEPTAAALPTVPSVERMFAARSW